MKRIATLFGHRRGRLRATWIAAAVLFALLAVMPVSPSLAYAVPGPIPICPDPISEGESAFMGLQWPGYHKIQVFMYSYHNDHTADTDDFVPYDRIKMTSQGDSDTVWIPVMTKDDSVPEHDETFELGTQFGGSFHSCVITIDDDDAPRITDVEITSVPIRGDTYRTGESIDVRVTLDQEAEVEARGDALIHLYLGEGNSGTLKGARYHQGSGGRFLIFRYQVQPVDRDLDGITVSSAAVGRNHNPSRGFSGNIYAKGTDVPIDYAHSGIEDASNHKVNGRPYVMNVGVTSIPPDGWEAYRANQIIEISLNFDIDVVVEGDVGLALYVGLHSSNWAEAWRESVYLRGSGTDTLVFCYTVQPGDMDTRGIMIPYGATAVIGNGNIKAKGADVEYLEHFPTTGHLPDHKIDTAPPTISGIYITSRPGNREAYRVGEFIRVEMVFSEPVTKAGDLQLELDVGGTIRHALLRPETNPNRRFNNDMVFEYQVQRGDADSDGIGISANSLTLNGGSIFDRAGNAAGLSHAALAADSVQKVETDSGN